MTWMELILRMLFCLLLAGIIGGIIGWLLRALRGGNQTAQLEEAWQGRLASKEREWEMLRADSRKQLAVTENKLSECNAGVQTHLATIADHEAKYAEFQAALAAKTTAHDQLSAEVAALKDQVATAESAAADWQGKLATAEASLTSKHSELGDLTTKLAAAAALATTLKSGSDEAEKFKAENTLLRQRIGGLESDLTGARAWESKYNALLGERESWQQQLTAAQTAGEAQHAAHTTTLAALQAQLQAANSAAAEAQGKLATAEAALTNNQSEVGGLTAKLAAAAALTTQLQAHTGESETLAAENHDLRARLTTLETQLANLQATSQAQASDWEMKALAAASDKEREIQELQKRVQELEPLGAQAKDWEVKYLAVLDEKQHEAQFLRSRVAELEPLSGRLSAIQAEAQSKDSQIHTLQNRLKELESAVVPDLEAIEGIGPVYFKKLSGLAGISWQKELLEHGKSAAGRKEIAGKTGILEALILRWVNHCDLRRVIGVTEQYAELLEVAGVDTVPELAQRNPDNLHAKVVETNEAKHVSPQTPTLDDIQQWIAQAKTLPRVVTH
ncbi:MAG: DUF4332 domain-containing protein [Blastocatellia bacterium]